MTEQDAREVLIEALVREARAGCDPVRLRALTEALAELRP